MYQKDYYLYTKSFSVSFVNFNFNSITTLSQSNYDLDATLKLIFLSLVQNNNFELGFTADL